jgi:hypothetical protein
MEFRRLLGRFDNEEIITKLNELYYKEEELDPTGYIQALDQLRILHVEESEHTLICLYEKVYDLHYYKVNAYVGEDRENTYSVSAMDWKEVLGSECELTEQVSELDFVTHTLYEITWFGFSYTQTTQTIEALFNEIEAQKAINL